MDELKPIAPRRITVGLTPRVRVELRRLMDLLQLTTTDVVNRSVSIHRLISDYDQDGYELVFRHRETGHEKVVEIL